MHECYISNSKLTFFFAKRFFTTAVTFLFSNSYSRLRCSSGQQNSMIHERSTRYFFLRHTPWNFLPHMLLFFLIGSKMPDDFHINQQLSLTSLKLTYIVKLDNFTISRTIIFVSAENHIAT